MSLRNTKKPLMSSRSSVSESYLSLLLLQDHIFVHFLRLWSLPVPTEESKLASCIEPQHRQNIAPVLVLFDKKTQIRLISEETLQNFNCCEALERLRQKQRPSAISR